MIFGKKVELKRNGARYINTLLLLIETWCGRRPELQEFCLYAPRKVLNNATADFHRVIEGRLMLSDDHHEYLFVTTMWGNDGEGVLGPGSGTININGIKLRFERHGFEFRVWQEGWDSSEYRSSKELDKLTSLLFSDRLRNFFARRGLKTIRDVMEWRNKNFENPPADITRDELNEIYEVITRAGLWFGHL